MIAHRPRAARWRRAFRRGQLRRHRSHVHLELRERPRHVARAQGRRVQPAWPRTAPNCAVLAEIARQSQHPELLGSEERIQPVGALARAAGARLARVVRRAGSLRSVARPHARRARPVGAGRHRAPGRPRRRSSACPRPTSWPRRVRTVRQQHWTLNAADMTATHLSDGAARARVVHQELHHRSRGRRPPCASPASTPSSSTSAATSSCAARSPEPSTSPIRKTMRRTARRSRRSSCMTARSRRAATTAAASTSRGVHYSHIVDPRTGMPAERRDQLDGRRAESRRCGRAGDGVLDSDAGREPDSSRRRCPASSTCSSTRTAGASPAPAGPRSRRRARPARTCRADGRRADGRRRRRRPRAARASARGIRRWSWRSTSRFPCSAARAQASVHRDLDRGRGQVPGADARALVSRGSVPHRSEGLVPRRPAAQHVGEHVDRPLHRRRHAPARQVHAQVGRQGQGRQFRQGRHLHRLPRVVARARHLSDRPAGDDASAARPVHVDFKPGTELGVVSFDYHKIAK